MTHPSEPSHPGRATTTLVETGVGAVEAATGPPTAAPATVSRLARPAPPTPRQARAAAKATAKTLRRQRTAQLAAERAARGPAIPANGLAGPAGGAAGVVDVPPEYRATTVQVCGLWPWAVGSGTPMIGTPIGHHLHTGATVCFDPISWFLRAKLISNPSLFMLGLPGLGKSTFIRKLVTGATATGVVPMILGDLKPDYADQVRALGGQVVSVGRGRGYLNPLAVGALGSILPRLHGRPAYDRVAAEVAARRLSMTSGLVSLVRREEITDTEQTIIATALRLLDEHAAATGDPTPPLLTDLVEVIKTGGEQLMAVTLTDTNTDYRAAVRRLHLSLIALMSGPVGEVFSRQTSVPLDLGAPAVCIDLSGIAATDERLTAAVLLACWSDGFGAIEAAHTLADEGLAPQRYVFAVLDEQWRVLRAGVGMVDRVDELTRLNRTLGLGQAMITHSLDDLDALASEADRSKARGFVERAGAVVCGGLPARELAALSQIVGFTGVEQDMITAWSAPSTLSTTGQALPPPGQGNFLIKIGSRTGIPLHVDLVAAERDSQLHNTNARWDPATLQAVAAGVAEVAAVTSASGITAATPGPEAAHTPTDVDPGGQTPTASPPAAGPTPWTFPTEGGEGR